MKHLLMPKLTEKQVARFWSKVDIGDKNECWEWMACLNQRGYGTVKFQYKMYYIHRIAYYLHTQKDPKELLVCHSCDNRKCCNSNHLWLGTLSDDMQDMIAKERGNKVKGSKHKLAKLTEVQVRQIRKQYTNGMSQRALGRKYNVAQSTIQCIVTRKTWKHI